MLLCIVINHENFEGRMMIGIVHIKLILRAALVLVVGTQARAAIHVFGDSHAWFCFTEQTKIVDKEFFIFEGVPFYIHWLGPRTIHGIGTHGLQRLAIQQYGVSENDTVVFVFGEIDVRCHLIKQHEMRRKDIRTLLHTLVGNYCKTIAAHRSLYKNLTCVVCSVVPPTDNGLDNEKFPRYGSLRQRIMVTQQLNALLQEYCMYNGFLFLDIYAELATTCGDFDITKKDGVVHVNPRCNEFIKRKLFTLLYGERQ